VLSDAAFVFGTAVGERVGDVKRVWQTCVLKAHGLKATWAGSNLDRASCARYQQIDVHLHDLRREFASRLLESDVPLHLVRDVLGHSNIAITSRYLASTSTALREAIAKKEAYEARLYAAASTAPPTPEENVEAAVAAVTH
jgi:integrase